MKFSRANRPDSSLSLRKKNSMPRYLKAKKKGDMIRQQIPMSL